MTAGPLVAPGLPVPPGSGWPEDPATPTTPVATDAAQVRTLAAGASPRISMRASSSPQPGMGRPQYCWVRDDARLTAAVSVNIGCVRMTERHLRHDPPGDDEIAAARADIDAALDVVAGKIPVSAARTLVGLAGSVTTVAALVLGLDSYQAERIHHTRVSVAAVREVTAS